MIGNPQENSVPIAVAIQDLANNISFGSKGIRGEWELAIVSVFSLDEASRTVRRTVCGGRGTNHHVRDLAVDAYSVRRLRLGYW